MKTIQIYNLHLINGDIIQAAEDYKLKGSKTLVNIFLIVDMLLGSCYVPKKNIVCITTGEVRIDAEPDFFETNICLLRGMNNRGSQD